MIYEWSYCRDGKAWLCKSPAKNKNDRVDVGMEVIHESGILPRGETFSWLKVKK